MRKAYWLWAVMVGMNVIVGCFRVPSFLEGGKGSAILNQGGRREDMSTVITEEGAQATFSAKSGSIQVLKANPASSLAGSEVAFPPGALALDAQVNITEAGNVASNAAAAHLGIETSFSQVATPVVVQSSTSIDAAKPFVVAVPLPSAGLRLQDYENLVVVYKVTVGVERMTRLGIVPRGDLEVEDGFAKISTLYFGVFQAAYTEEPVVKAVTADVATPILTAKDVKVLPALSVMGRKPFIFKAGDQVELTGANFRPTMIVALGTKKVTGVQVMSDSAVRLVAPADAGFGLVNFNFDQDGVSQTVSVVYRGGKDDYPVIGEVETEVCAGKKYYGLNGDLKTGTKDCTGPDLTNLMAANIKAGVTVAGITGTATLESHSNCTSDGATGCVTTLSFKSADMTNVLAVNISSGVTIAGVVGAGTVESHTNCASDGATGCVTTSSFKAADMTSVVAGNIKSGVTIAGVGGSSIAEAHSNCASDGATGCVATSSYKAADMSSVVAGNIKSGVTIAGVSGDYPSGSHPLAGATGTADLDLATFNPKIKSGTSFEWFDSSGTRYSNAGDPDIAAGSIATGVDIFGTTGTFAAPCAGDGQQNCLTTSSYPSVDAGALSAWDIRAGKQAGGLTGSLKFCKNAAATSIFNNSTAPATASLDTFDTIDDYNNNLTGIPSQNPFSSISGGVCGSSNWVDLTADGACDAAGDNCTFKDLISGLQVAEKLASTYTWSSALTQCDNLTFVGYSDWRLPTEKELLQLSIDGIRSIESTYFGDMDLIFWSATTQSNTTTYAYNMDLGAGVAQGIMKTTAASVVCVRP